MLRHGSRSVQNLQQALQLDQSTVSLHLPRLPAKGVVGARTCKGWEVEIGGVRGPQYGRERFGLHFVASPRHADCLLVTGPVTRNMAEALRRTYYATPDPKIVIAAGDCAGDGGIFRGSYAVIGGGREIVPVDALIRGCPPSPAALLARLLDALGRPR